MSTASIKARSEVVAAPQSHLFGSLPDSQVADDIPDPFYGVLNAAIAQASLRRTVHEIALGCRGLLSYLLKLQAR